MIGVEQVDAGGPSRLGKARWWILLSELNVKIAFCVCFAEINILLLHDNNWLLV